MEKNSFRSNHQASSKGLNTDSKKNQDVSSKQWPRNSRRRESPNLSNSKSEPTRNTKQSQGSKTRFNNFNEKRPRQRGGYPGGSALDASSSSAGLDESTAEYEAEVNSVYVPGSKKQNMNQLLNFHYVSRDNARGSAQGFSKHGHNRAYIKKPKYNKEQFLQANCQFVVKEDGDYSVNTACADTLVDWTKIEQINFQSAEDPQCPICLFPPVASKMTKCGHVYCWSCILHYLALSDKEWRKCPICYESVYIKDLKSVISKPHRNFNVNDVVTFQLMRREKGQLHVTKANTKVCKMKIPHLSETTDNVLHSKLLLANVVEIISIIDREKRELNDQRISDGADCPENVFIDQAMVLLNTRQEQLREWPENRHLNRMSESSEISEISDINEESKSPLPTLETDDATLIIDEESNLTLQDVDIIPASDTSKYFFFYQASDGQHLYLHNVNTRMLQTMYGSIENSPQIIEGRILQKQNCSITDDLRRRLKYLQHLPVSCQFEVVEIQMDHSIISNDVFDRFKDELNSRKKTRQRRAREETIRDRHIQQVNERQLTNAFSRSTNLNAKNENPYDGQYYENIDINSNQQFPTTMSASSPSNSTILESAGAYSGGTISSSPSFATMLTATPVNVWPSMSTSPMSQSESRQKVTQVTGYKQQSSGTNRNRVDSDEEYDEDRPRVPEFRQSFGSAIAEALQKAKTPKKKDDGLMGSDNAAGVSSANCSGKKKKNKKSTVLFSTGMAFNGKN